MRVRVLKTDNATDISLPRYETNGAAGMDLRANIPKGNIEVIKPGQILLVKAGIRLEIPVGIEVQIRPRSGLAAKHGITVLNSPGTIDSDFRGELGVILINHGTKDFEVERGDRIAQMVFSRHERVKLVEQEELSQTKRGTGAFGHTGK